MQYVPTPVFGITHPAVRGMYLKKDFRQDRQHRNVLVIETFSRRKPETGDSFLGLLTDLNDLHRQAREKIGQFDRIEIRQH